MRFFGKYSYGIYVFHGILAYHFHEIRFVDAVTRWIGSHLAAVFVQAVVGIALSLLIAVVSYEWFEKHFLALKKWFGDEAAVAREPQPQAEPGRASA